MATVLAIEITPSSPVRWRANYYPTVATPMGRRVEIATALHQQSLPPTERPGGQTWWLEAFTADPTADCYTGYPVWGPHLAAGYAAALIVYEAKAIVRPPRSEDAQALSEAAVMIVPGQLSEWLLTDLRTSQT